MYSHKDLEVWKLAVDLAEAAYAATSYFPKDEQFGLSLQIRRSAVSISSNIAESAARNGKKEFVQYLYVALGSASELDTQIEIARRAKLGEPAHLKNLDTSISRVSKMLLGLIRSVKSRATAATKRSKTQL